MEGKLNPEEVRSVLRALSGVSRSMGSCLESLEESQKKLDKSIECQDYLNYSLKPVQTAFTLKENVASGSEAGGRF